LIDPSGLCDLEMRCDPVGEGGGSGKALARAVGSQHCYLLATDWAGAGWKFEAMPSHNGDRSRAFQKKFSGDRCPKCSKQVDCSKIQCLKARTRDYDNAGNGYDPTGTVAPNSNSFVEKIMRQCGMPVSNFPSGAYGCYFWYETEVGPDPRAGMGI
jgi:hypothetical protein